LDQAAIEFRAVIESNKDHFRAHHNLGFVLEKQGRFDDAMVAYQNALEVKPDYVNARKSLARVKQLLKNTRNAPQ